MSVTIHGKDQLMSRIRAIRPNRRMMEELGLTAVANQKRIVKRKTGNLGRTIGLGSITDTQVETIATADYAAAVERGTRPHEIVPKRKRALRWAVGNARLSGSPRTGGAVRFAKRVRHPGTKAQPFMLPGAVAAVESFGAEAIVRRWNDAG